jgi:uncharacterized protein (DUF1015 family)
MADIRPLRAWRYNPTLERKIENLTSPLFDVVSDRQRKVLYNQPFNSIHLSVPQGPDPAASAYNLMVQWKQNGVLVQDRIPGIYVYYQYFKLPGDPRPYCRKGFICHIRTYDWEERVIMRHENTMPHAVNDRTELLRKTNLHVNPTHGLYTDASFELEKKMDEAMAFPILETEDYQGVRDVLAVIHDAGVIRQFMEVLHDKTVILADGHHRYESSLKVKHERAATNPHHTGEEGYNFHLMYLTNTEAGDFKILPTHRLIHGMEDLQEMKLIDKLKDDFDIKPIDDPETLPEVIAGKKWTFGLLFRESAWKIRLRPEVFPQLRWQFPAVIKELDVTVLHYFVIEKALGIAGRVQRGSRNISFDRSFSDCLAKVIRQEAQLALITQEITIEEVKRACASGATMPQKSTYFYPKVICGFLFSSILEDEFREPEYMPF